MSATKILWGQIVVVFAIVLITTWAATQWVAWKLGYQPQLGRPWFELAPGIPVYLPPAFFWWWYAYDAYAPHVFVEGAYIAASGGFISIAAAIAMSVWRAREAKVAATYGSARWADLSDVGTQACWPSEVSCLDSSTSGFASAITWGPRLMRMRVANQNSLDPSTGLVLHDKNLT